MMRPIKTAQFAELRILGESIDLASDTGIPSQDGASPNPVVDHTVGFAMNLRISENLGSTQRNVLGNPVPIFIPGFYQGTISASKATVDLESWKTMANINPYVAYLPNTYDIEEAGLDLSDVPDYAQASGLAESGGKVPRFLFGIYVHDKIANKANTTTGLYVGMLQSYNTAYSANDAIVMEDLSILVRPVQGSWLSVLRNYYTLNTFFGYDPKIKPQK